MKTKLKFIRWIVLFVIALTATACSRPQPGETSAAEAVRLNNLGTMRMSQERGEDALKLFQQAYSADPNLSVSRLNQGIALLALQRLDDARALLLETARLLPRSPRAWYNLGLLYRANREPELALQAFTRAAELDPTDADSDYFVGVMQSELHRYPDAITAFRRALTVSPFHASAEFGLARAYQFLGDERNAAEHLARFQRVTRDRLGTPLGAGYPEQGKYSLVEDVVSPSPTGPAISVRFTSVADAAGLAFIHRSSDSSSRTLPQFLGSGACFLDFDGDAQDDVFLLNGNNSASSALFRNTGGGFTDVTGTAGVALKGQGLGCTAGDYNNDGFPDLAAGFLDRVVLLKNNGNGSFEDVTRSAGINTSGLPLGLTFIDFDHDGDLDLYISRFQNFQWRPGNPFDFPMDAPGRNILWRNNGNGTFTDMTRSRGLAGAAPGVMAAGTDFNNDRAVDIILSSWSRMPTIEINPREGNFSAAQPWTSSQLRSTAGAIALDFNKDGWMDVAFTHWGGPGLSLWRNLDGKSFQQVVLPDLHWTEGWGLALMDYDNDGWLDLAAAGETGSQSEIRLLRNRGGGSFQDVTAATGLDTIQVKDPRSLITADYDNDGDTDILITQNNGPVLLLRNDGGNQNNWMHIALKGLNDNKSGIGTKVEVFAGTLRQKWEITSSSGYLGQSALKLIIGLGAARSVDFVRLLWPTGVPQDEEAPVIRQTHTIQEIDRRGSSCPILFAWDGSRFEFIADGIGAGIVGYWEGPGRRNVSDPTEYIKIEGAQLEQREGRLSLRFLEPMEELVFLDQVRLLAVDHPAELSVFPNEYFAAVPPFPKFKVIASRDVRPPAGAWDDQKRDLLPELLHRDRHYVTNFGSQPFAGFADLHTLELDLGEKAGSGPLRLVMYGYVDYFSANSMFAAYQAGVAPILPYIEAQNAAGAWRRVIDNIGFPAGSARPMVADLSGRLPSETRRIRIRTNLRVYWDQILIDRTPDGQPFQTSEIPLVDAKLSFHGYPQPVEGSPRSDVTYVYDHVSATGPYARHAGAYTRFGDVLSLVTAADDEFVIFGSGEQVELEFDSSRLPAPRPGWTRDYFFYADGFVKDMDFYEANSQTVEPLPYHTPLPYPYAPGESYPRTKPHLAYELNFNTRHSSGTPAPAYRFQYRGR